MSAAFLSKTLFCFCFSSLFHVCLSLYDTEFREMLQTSKHRTCRHESIKVPKWCLSKPARHLLTESLNFLQDYFSGIRYSPMLNFSVLDHYWDKSECRISFYFYLKENLFKSCWPFLFVEVEISNPKFWNFHQNALSSYYLKIKQVSHYVCFVLAKSFLA